MFNRILNTPSKHDRCKYITEGVSEEYLVLFQSKSLLELETVLLMRISSKKPLFYSSQWGNQNDVKDMVINNLLQLNFCLHLFRLRQSSHVD